MKKRSRISVFNCLTLLRPDLEELIHNIQNDLQDIEIIIDDRRILNSADLGAFSDTYQAKSLVIRGYYKKAEIKDAQVSDERHFLELKKTKV